MPAAAACGLRPQRAHHPAEDPRSPSIVRPEVLLDPERLHVDETRPGQERYQPRSDRRTGARAQERGVGPREGLGDEGHGRFSAGRAQIEVERDQQASGPERSDVVLEDRQPVRQVEQDQPSDHRVEWLVAAPGPHVALGKTDLRMPGSSPDCHVEQSPSAVDSNDPSFDPHEPGRGEGHVSESRPEVEHPHSTDDARSAEEHARRAVEEGGLRVQARDLVVFRTQGILRRAACSLFGDRLYRHELLRSFKDSLMSRERRNATKPDTLLGQGRELRSNQAGCGKRRSTRAQRRPAVPPCDRSSMPEGFSGARNGPR
jgi:hypothetical protein